MSRHSALIPLLLLATTACAHDPVSTDAAVAEGSLRMDLSAASVGQPITCGTTAPATVTVTDSRGKPLNNFLVNFRPVDGYTTVFAGADLTNARGAASDVFTAGNYPGVPLDVEIRSVDPATAVPTVHATITRPVVMSASASVEVLFGPVVPRSPNTGIASNIYVRIHTGCFTGNPQNPVEVTLPDGTPVSVTGPTGQVDRTAVNSQGTGTTDVETLFTYVGPGTYTLQAGTPTTTGVASLVFVLQ